MSNQNNPFAVTKSESAEAVMVEAASTGEIARIQSMMVIAKKFPRDQKAAVDRILQACERPRIAEDSTYSFPRGTSQIEGPSIRLAEVIAQNWGNLEAGVRELEQRPGESTMEAYAWDLETNTRINKTFQVRHIRRANKQNVKLEDPRDVYEMTANQGARRLRACILAIVPKDVVDTAVQQCQRTLAAAVDVTPDGINKMLSIFADQFGVTKAMIEKRLQRDVMTISPATMLKLRSIFASLRDGMSGVADWFETAQPTPEPTTANLQGGVDGLKDAIPTPGAEGAPEPQSSAKESEQPQEQQQQEQAPPKERPKLRRISAIALSVAASKVGYSDEDILAWLVSQGKLAEGQSYGDMTPADKIWFVDNAHLHRAAMSPEEPPPQD